MARKKKFHPDWKFAAGTWILVPSIELTTGFFTEAFVGIVYRHHVYSRSNCRYLCRDVSTNLFKELDLQYVNRYATIADNKVAKLLYGGK